MSPKTLITTLALLTTLVPATAKKTHSGRVEANTPEQEQAGFTVPEGYIIELVASEKDGIVNPIDLAFDDAGNLWTQTARMYPLDPVTDIPWNELLRLMDNPVAQDKNPEFKRIKDLYQGKTKGTDDILILSNIYDKKPLQVKKFATGLTIPQSILPYKNGAYIMQGSELFYLEDTDNNGTADKRTPILTGFGFTDTHTMGHCLVRAPGGWINFSQGALNKGEITAVKSGESTRIDFSKIARVSLDGNHIQLVNAGLNNIWGFNLRSNGQWFMTEANDQGWSVVPADPFTTYKGIGGQKLRPYQPDFPALHKFRVGGTGISGLAFTDDLTGKFATEYKDVAFLANPITSKINAVKIIRNPNGTVTAKHLPDFLTSRDDWFRPVHIDFGPDGNLYIADWYNKIVSHNEVTTSHPDRDKSHGRIWRVRPKTAEERKVPNLYKTPTDQLVDHLQSPYAWERKAAWQQIADRQAKELIPQLKTLAADTSANINHRIPALWSLESLGAFDQSLITKLAQDNDDNMRRETLRALITLKTSPEFLAKILTNIATEPNVQVRSQALRTIEQLGKTNPALINLAVTFCHPAATDNNLGAGYEINFERYLARRALEQYPKELKAYLTTEAAKQQPAANLIWAQQSLGSQTATAFAKQWETLKQKPLNKETLIIISNLSPDPKIRDIVKPYFANKNNAQHIANTALENIAEAYNPSIGLPLAETTLQLINSPKETDKILGLQLGRAYRITHLSPQYAALLPITKSNPLKLEIIKTLSHLPNQYTPAFKTLITDKTNTPDTQIAALTALVQAKQNNALPEVTTYLTEKPNTKPAIITSLGSTTQGCLLLTKLIDQKTITPPEIPTHIAQRIADIHKTNPTAQAILKNAKERKAADEKSATEKITELEKQIIKTPGNPAAGKAIFTGMCLTCHVVRQEGIGIAPALDGSATRDTNHLLTAILKPNEAAENAYILFRTIETSGHITEGLKLKQDKHGTTLAHQGGSTTFIPSRTLKSQQHVASTSFMPSGIYDKLPNQILADILAHIKTLK